jgi:4-hydroxy-tetrahydrodipicolinate reductase
MAALPIAIFGISGRMGQSLIRALREDEKLGDGALGLRLAGAMASSASPQLGRDAAIEGPATGVTVTADAGTALSGAKLALDFSQPAAVLAHARACAAARVPLLIGVTGFDGAVREALGAVAREIPLLLAPNTSVGVSVLNELAAVAAKALGLAYDVEIGEAHHAGKRDAPSGTALKLGETVAGARGQAFSEAAAYDRAGASRIRAAGSIGFSVLRAGDIVGEHTVTFAAAGERVELTHRATDRMIFARGALRAGQWLAAKPPGLYAMKDVLGL